MSCVGLLSEGRVCTRLVILIALQYLLLAPQMLYAQKAKRKNSPFLSEPTLQVIFKNIETDGTDKTGRLRPDRVCAKFAQYFLKGKGVWGMGAFDQSFCGMSKGAGKAADASHLWTLQVSQEDGRIVFGMYYGKAASGRPEASYEVETDDGALQTIGNQKLAYLISSYLMASMPFRSFVTKEQLEKRKKLGGRVGDLAGIVPDPSLFLFALKQNNSLWAPSVIGKANLISKPTAKKHVWKLELNSDVDSDSKAPVYFIQGVENRKERLAQIDLLIKDNLSKFLDKILSVGKSVYVGARYGFPVVKGDSLISAPMIGFFGEFRGGILNGIMLNYDAIPHRETVENGAQRQFSWSRFQLGYAIGTKVNWPLINWVDFTPTIGVTSMKLESISPLDSDLVSYDFQMTKAPTIGGEIGLERRRSYLLARLWGFASYSVSVLAVDKKRKTTSMRGGLDLYTNVAKMGPIQLAILGFGAAENTIISSQDTAPAEVSEDEEEQVVLEVRNFTYTTTYVGLGLTLTW